MADMDSIKARIRALRTRTVENGCTEAEALAAAAKVMDLLAKHGLAAGDEEIAQEDVALGLRSQPALQPLFVVVAWVCHCELLTVERWDRSSARYVGRDPWPEAAAYLHAVVIGAARRALTEFKGSVAYRRRRPAARLVAEHSQ
jgi:hypothetical protein